MSRYGPHRPEDAPTTVMVLGAERWPVERPAPIPAALAEQRRNINTRAQEAAP